MDFTIEQITLFAIFTLITFGQGIAQAVVNRRQVNNQGEEIRNETMSAMNDIAKDALGDFRSASNNLYGEVEKRAKLEGTVEQLVRDLELERIRANQAEAAVAEQNGKSEERDKQVTKLFNQVQEISEELTSVKQRLEQAEKDKARLIKEKDLLQVSLGERESDYDSLMESVQSRIDKAVSDVREELRQDYERQLENLRQQIRDKDVEINMLKAKLQEESPDEKNSPTQPIPYPDDSADGQSATIPPIDPSAGRDRKPPSDTGSHPDSGTGNPTTIGQPTNDG